MPSFMPSFFRVPKPKHFGYNPRFYDPEKERLEKLKQKYAEQDGNDELADRKARMIEELRAQRPRRKTDGLLSKNRLLIYLLLIVLLILAVWR